MKIQKSFKSTLLSLKAKMQFFLIATNRNSFLVIGICFCLLAWMQNADLLKEAHSSSRRKSGEFSSSQSPNTSRDFFLFGDYVHDPDIHTVLFFKEGLEQSQPHIRFHSDETLQLIFDDLNLSSRNFYYTIIHCDAHWQPSALQQFEYIDGFHEGVIDNYTRSINTIVPFTQYRLQIPNETMRPRLPGNYILKVYLNSDPRQVVFTRRFVIFEQLVTIYSTVRPATLVQFRNTHQQIRFEINTQHYPVANPNRDLRVVVLQNGRWDNAIRGVQPRSILGTQLIFDHDNRLLFEAGNEFRRFDIRSLRFRSERVDQIIESHRHKEIILRPDRIRAFSPYLTERDINGRFEINTHDAADAHLESDYATVHFRLPANQEFPNARVHVIGSLTGWAITPHNQLHFNAGSRAYELSLLLKQGFYNYKFILVDKLTSTATFAETEGNFSITENDYTILVYHRQPGTLFDRLIGISHHNSLSR